MFRVRSVVVPVALRQIAGVLGKLGFNLPPTPQLRSLEPGCTGQAPPRGRRCRRWRSFLSGSHGEELPLFLPSWEPSARVGPYRSCTAPLHTGGIIPALICSICAADAADAAVHFCRQFINIEKMIGLLLQLSSPTMELNAETLRQKMIAEAGFHILVLQLI